MGGWEGGRMEEEDEAGDEKEEEGRGGRITQ